MGTRLQAAARLLAIAVACVLSVGAGSAAAFESAVSDVVRPAGSALAQGPRDCVATADRTGAPLFEVSYRSEISALGGANSPVSARVRFDDGWFFGAPTTYDNDLARTCAALSAACNSQSRARVAGEGDAVSSLSNLGFEDIDVSSYEGRSRVVDELLNVFQGETDVVAYTIAHRALHDEAGRYAGELVFVGVRGTYGSEWVSNFNVGSGGAAGVDDAPHAGFARASSEVASSVDAYLARHGLDDGDITFLVSGHSRGGAVANLLAAGLIDRACAGGVAWSADDVRAYTFASPNVTGDAARTDARYDAVFNVANPADAVTRVPLASRGMGLYGATVEIPAGAGDCSPDSFGRMQESRAQLTGCSVEGERASAADALDVLEGALDGMFAYSGSLGFALRAVDVAASVVNIDPVSTLVAHSPDTYLSWLSVLEPASLRFGAR